MPTSREQWFADVLQAGLDTHVLAEPDILAHATPAVLVGALPKDVVVRMLDAALGSGTISPKAVVAHASPELLAQHVPPGVVWSCIASAAERAGVTATEATGRDASRDDGRDDGKAREFLRRALAAALARAVLTPSDVVQHVDARVIVHHLPEALTTKLLEVSLAAGRLDAQLVVDTIGIDQIARHAPSATVWACLARAGDPGKAAAAPVPAPTPAAVPEPIPEPTRPALEVLDDDIASVLVDLDDSQVLSVESIKEAETVVEKPKKVAERAKR
jgi:hypothetical protein